MSRFAGLSNHARDRKFIISTSHSLYPSRTSSLSQVPCAAVREQHESGVEGDEPLEELSRERVELTPDYSPLGEGGDSR